MSNYKGFRGGFKQGIFTPTHPEKYKGKTPIVMRSSWEFAYARWCDINKNVIEWGSESAVVPYFDVAHKKNRHYFIDFTMKIKDVHGVIHKYYIEIKPFAQTVPPTKGPRKKNTTFMNECMTFATNVSKWKAATQFAKSKGAEFKILTEKEIMRYQ